MDSNLYFKRNKNEQWCWVTEDNRVINSGDWVSSKFYNDKHFSNSYKVSPNPVRKYNPYYLKYTIFERIINYLKTIYYDLDNW